MVKLYNHTFYLTFASNKSAYSIVKFKLFIGFGGNPDKI